MRYQTLLCILDDTTESDARLRVATGLAQRFGSHLVGLMVAQPIYIPTYIESDLPREVIEQQKEAAAGALQVAGDKFLAACEKVGINGEWRQAQGNVATVAALHARYSDLTICGAPHTEGMYGNLPNLAEELVMQTGGPVLVVPGELKSDDIGTSIVVGWDASREAARAVHDGLDFLTNAKQTVVVSANPRSGESAGTHGEAVGADLGVLLARHGVKVEARAVKAHKSAGEILLDAVDSEGADLLVMGAYGHSRVREMVLGGVTRHILAHPKVAVLMSH
jgi:nucleotide-binding universal stress UspA family protein